MLDLHLHSTCSDGAKSPEELVALAAGMGLRAVALTDHDTVDGAADFMRACRGREHLTGLAGVELSAKSEHGTLHILGLGIDPSNEALQELLARVRESRWERNRRILAKLNGLGFPLTWEEVDSFAGGDVTGRPHFAMAMIAHGWAESMSEVFERFLGKGAPAYEDRMRPAPEEAIAAIKNAGGVASVAHPVSWHVDFDFLEESFRRLKGEGLDALECLHPMVGRKARENLLGIARRLGLLVTGGSDYHGLTDGDERDPHCDIGSVPVPDDLLEPILRKASPYGIANGEIQN